MPSPHIVMNARNVTLTLGEKDARVEILRGIDLSVENGETVALLGASGSGKSSLMAVLAGLERASGGDIEIAGADFGMLDEDGLALARRGRIGIILQAFHLLPTMTALENVAVPLELAGMDAPFDRAREELALVGLAERTGHYPAQLSGGEQQRVAIARAIVTDPTILVADEPTGDLDRASAEEILSMMERLNDDMGKTIIMVTHDPRAAARAHTLRHLDKGYLNHDAVQNPL